MCVCVSGEKLARGPTTHTPAMGTETLVTYPLAHAIFNVYESLLSLPRYMRL